MRIVHPHSRCDTCPFSHLRITPYAVSVTGQPDGRAESVGGSKGLRRAWEYGG